MKRISLLLIATLTAAILAGQSQTQEAALGAAVHREEVEGDLNGAIAAYQKLLSARGLNRKLAAQALFHLGLCYQKQGDAKARQAFERLVNEYGDTAWAAQARTRIAALSARPGQPSTALVWGDGKVADEAAISPDGRFLTQPDWDTGNLILHDLLSGANRSLITGTWKHGEAEFAEESAISRDGKQVAFGWYQAKSNRFDLRIANLTGEPNPRKIFESPDMRFVAPRDWSPDGQWIALGLEPENSDARTNQPVRPGMHAALGLVAVRDGSLRVLKTADWSGPDTGFAKIQFSPDGKYLVYSCQNRGFILSVSGESDTPLVSGPSSVRFPMWTPDGLRIVFVSDRAGAPALWSIRVAEGKPQGEPEQLNADGAAKWPIGITREGSLFYEAGRVQSNIYMAGLNPESGALTSDFQRVNQLSVNSATGRVAWLPDGKSLSYRGTVGGHPALIVHNLATGEDHEVPPSVTGAAPFGYSGWFPDGSVMLSETSGQTITFRRVDVRTGQAQPTWKVATLPADALAHGFSSDLMTWYYRRGDTAGHWTVRPRPPNRPGSRALSNRRASGAPCDFTRRPPPGLCDAKRRRLGAAPCRSRPKLARSLARQEHA